jgi:hypothetical protein
MTELLGPTFTFDVNIGEAGSKVLEIDVDRDNLVSQMRRSRLSDEVINDTVFYFNNGAWDIFPKVRMHTVKRYVAVYLGHYAAAEDERVDRASESLIASIDMSVDLAHEIEHLRQIEDRELPLVPPLELTMLPYEERPWEQGAHKAGEDYFESYRRKERELLGVVLLK